MSRVSNAFDVFIISTIIFFFLTDVVKTRFQVQKGNSEYKSVIDCFQKTIRNEG